MARAVLNNLMRACDRPSFRSVFSRCACIVPRENVLISACKPRLRNLVFDSTNAYDGLFFIEISVFSLHF